MQAVHDKHREKMDSPSNGVSIVGYLRPAFIEEESYLRSLFHGECNGDGYSSDWRDECKREPAPASGTNGLIGKLISCDQFIQCTLLFKFCC
jgi:hypothetical protein